MTAICRYGCLAAIVALVTACSASPGFNSGALATKLNSSGPVTTDDAIARTFALKPQLPRPFRLGVYFVPPKNRSGGGTLTWGWSEEDKNRILALANPLKANKEISGAYLISDAVVNGSDLDAYRLAAARYGADAILVISGINDVDSYFNGWGWTYVLILPALFVPASERDALFVTQAVMWDVRNEFLYLAADGQSLKTQTRPAAYIDEKKLVNEAKAEAFDKLCAQISNMVGDLLQQQIKQ